MSYIESCISSYIVFYTNRYLVNWEPSHSNCTLIRVLDCLFLFSTWTYLTTDDSFQRLFCFSDHLMHRVWNLKYNYSRKVPAFNSVRSPDWRSMSNIIINRMSVHDLRQCPSLMSFLECPNSFGTQLKLMLCGGKGHMPYLCILKVMFNFQADMFEIK